MIGRAARVKPRMAPWTARPTRIGSEMAQFFGTSSPSTIDTPVAMMRARATATAETVDSDQPNELRGGRSNVAMEGSAMKPITRLVTVIPSCAPESCVERDANPSCRPFARVSPSSASRSTLARSTVTNENSAATKSAHAATSSSASTSSSQAITATRRPAR